MNRRLNYRQFARTLLAVLGLGLPMAVSKALLSQNAGATQIRFSNRTNTEYNLDFLDDRVDSEGKYDEFTYQTEIPDILKHAKRIGVEPELLMAIRDAEDGRDEIAYGILPQGKAKERYDKDKGYKSDGEFHQYKDEKEKQLCWAGWTIKRNLERFKQDPEGHEDFISYLAEKYAPINVANDPNNLNNNWENNVRQLNNEFRN